MYVLLEFWQKKIMAIPIMNPLSWFMMIMNKVPADLRMMNNKCCMQSDWCYMYIGSCTSLICQIASARGLASPDYLTATSKGAGAR